MSNFLTRVPVRIDETRKLLPADAFIEKVTLDEKAGSLIVIWHSPRLHTGFTFPLEFTLEQLASRDLPKGVKDLPRGPRHLHLQQEKEDQAPEPVPVTPAAPTPPKRGKKPKVVSVDV